MVQKTQRGFPGERTPSVTTHLCPLSNPNHAACFLSWESISFSSPDALGASACWDYSSAPSIPLPNKKPSAPTNPACTGEGIPGWSPSTRCLLFSSWEFCEIKGCTTRLGFSPACGCRLKSGTRSCHRTQPCPSARHCCPGKPVASPCATAPELP